MTTPAERVAALDAAVQGPERERAIILALEDDAVAVRDRAIRLAARYVEPAVLGAMVADGENAVRRNAGLSALERQGPYAVPHLTVMLGDPDPELVMFALQSLARIGYAPAGRSILPLLHHSDPNVAQSAIEAVGQLRTREAVPALLKLVDGELWLQLAAINALGAIGAPEAVRPLMSLVPDSVLAEPAVQALRSIAAPESLETLLALLPVVHERALRDPLLLAVAVVIDLHPDAAPLLMGAGAELAASPEMVEYLGSVVSAAGPDEEPDADADSLRRAAATLAVAAGIEALEPRLLAQLSSDPSSAWLEGLFRHFPEALAGRRARLLGHADARVRSGVLRAARFEEDELPELFDHLEDADAGVRAAACYAMGRLGLDSTAPLLVERLRRGQPEEQAAAAQALTRLSADALADLESCLRPDTTDAVLALALDTLAARPVPAFEAQVLRLAEDKRPAVRRAGLRAVARLPIPRADVLLLRALADRNQATQVEALELLVARGGEQSIAVLVAMLGTSDSLRFHVIRALGHCRAQSAAAKLRTVFPDCGPHEQLQIVTSLIRIAPPWIGAYLRERLGDAELEMRRMAAQGLADLAQEHELPVLLPLAEDADWSIRNEAARGLGRLAKPVTRQVLLALARDVEPVVAATARASLERLQPEAIRISA
ncbi:MAG TPA: HEAT repeat domain-containing protein [Gemmatimonadales bacterium]|nr:HEAT repeat domain-containing protein [Gemmatimonadales bacterium]